jgi:hypothetical protein
MQLRVWQRHNCELEVSCRPLAARGDNDPHWSAVIRDLSIAGIGLILGRRFERGTSLAIEIPTPEDTTESLLVRVAHATNLPDGKWLLGCAFVTPLSEEELEGLLRIAQARATTPSEVPRNPAQPAAETEIRNVLLAGVGRPGGVGKLAARRVRLRGAWPLRTGTLVYAWIGGRDTATRRIAMRVHRCFCYGGCWTLQYSLVDEPDQSTLRLLAFPEAEEVRVPDAVAAAKALPLS